MTVWMVPGDNPIHPARQIVQDPRISIFVDCEAGTGVQAGEMQSPVADTCCGQPSVDDWVETREPAAARRNIQLVLNHCQLISHSSRLDSINLGSDVDDDFEPDGFTRSHLAVRRRLPALHAGGPLPSDT